MRTVIEETELYTLSHMTGKTKFRGCQCFKDCTCNEDFKSEDYDYYTVKKKFNKVKTTNHGTIEDARIRIEFLKTIPVNYFQ
jgi:hypothetical protein